MSTESVMAALRSFSPGPFPVQEEDFSTLVPPVPAWVTGPEADRLGELRRAALGIMAATENLDPLAFNGPPPFRIDRSADVTGRGGPPAWARPGVLEETRQWQHGCARAAGAYGAAVGSALAIEHDLDQDVGSIVGYWAGFEGRLGEALENPLKFRRWVYEAADRDERVSLQPTAVLTAEVVERQARLLMEHSAWEEFPAEDVGLAQPRSLRPDLQDTYREAAILLRACQIAGPANYMRQDGALPQGVEVWTGRPDPNLAVLQAAARAAMVRLGAAVSVDELTRRGIEPEAAAELGAGVALTGLLGRVDFNASYMLEANRAWTESTTPISVGMGVESQAEHATRIADVPRQAMLAAAADVEAARADGAPLPEMFEANQTLKYASLAWARSAGTRRAVEAGAPSQIPRYVAFAQKALREGHDLTASETWSSFDSPAGLGSSLAQSMPYLHSAPGSEVER